MAILEMQHISKSFGGSHALKNVHLEIEEGEIHALLGENGAGKSTLMNILTGVYQADEGKFIWLGKEYVTPTIKEMEDAGIAFVHQELSVINDLSVTDNIFINNELTNKVGIINYKEEVKRTKELFESLGVDINPMALVGSLKTSEKQLLEICRALYKDAKLIILDEPTTSLSNSEIDHLFDILRNLKAQGKSFIFISHKMPEIFTIADRYTVFRNGEFISSGYIKDTNANAITSDMVGKAYADTDLYRPRELGETVLELKNYSDTVVKGEYREHISSEISATIDEARDISFNLIPFISSNESGEGFINVVKNYSAEILLAKEIHFTISSTGFNKVLLPEDLRISMFRICQEILNNIVKYSKADTVTMKFLYSYPFVIL